MDEIIKCSLCGTLYAPDAGRSSCQSCPLHSGCAVSCCPNCGTANINPAESRLARLVRSIFQGGSDALASAQKKLGR